MPELPDVEGYRRVAEQHVSRKTVREVHVGDPAVVRNTTPQGLGRALSGATVLTPRWRPPRSPAERACGAPRTRWPQGR